MSRDALILRDDARHAITFGDAAEERKADALTAGLSVNRVSNNEEQKVAVDVQRQLHVLIADVEKERKRVKAPVLEFGKLIDSTAKEWVDALIDERERIAGMVSNFAAIQEEKRKQAEREAAEKRRVEMEKIEAERREAERKAREVEAKRLAELRAKQAEIDKADKAKRDAAELEIKKAEELARKERERLAAEARDKEQKLFTETVVSAPAKAKGQRVRRDWEIEVVNASDLARCHPELVTITPRLLDIKDALNDGRTIAGIHAEKVVKSSVTVRGGKAIDV